MNQSINTHYEGQNIIKTINEFSILLEAHNINNDIRNNIISYIDKNINNKAYGVNYILDIDTSSIKNNELPLLPLNNNIFSYTYKLKLPVKYLNFNINQELKAYLNIIDGDIPKIIAYTKFIKCEIKLDDRFIVNLSEKSLTFNNKKYMKQDECMIKIIDIYNSTGSNKLLGSAVMIEEE